MAEAAKILENIFRAVNIALVNELKVVLDRMGIDVWEVIEAAKTKPFGFMPFYPGPGLGGHCIPLDPFYLTWKAAEHGAWARFIELAGEINTAMPQLRGRARPRARSTATARASRARRSSSWASATRPTSTTTASRPRSRSSSGCGRRGPRSPTATPTSRWRGPGASTTSRLSSVPCTAEEFARHDVLVVSTAHSDFKDAALYAGAKLVVDTRNLMAPLGLGVPGAAGPEVCRA